MTIDVLSLTTHEAAQLLIQLARLLKDGPDIRLKELTTFAPHRQIASSEIPGALSALVALSDIDKSQWRALIDEHRFPIQVRPRDASRDILGKLLKYLEASSDARARLKLTATSKSRSHISPELMNALNILLK